MNYVFPVHDSEHNALNWLCRKKQPWETWKPRADLGDLRLIRLTGLLINCMQGQCSSSLLNGISLSHPTGHPTQQEGLWLSTEDPFSQMLLRKRKQIREDLVWKAVGLGRKVDIFQCVCEVLKNSHSIFLFLFSCLFFFPSRGMPKKRLL